MAQQNQSNTNFFIGMGIVAFIVTAVFTRWGVSLMDGQSAAGETYKGFGAAGVFVIWLLVMAGFAGISFFVVRRRRPVDMDASEAELAEQRAARSEADETESDEDSYEAKMARMKAALGE